MKKYYGIDTELYHKFWISMEKTKGRPIEHTEIDRWLSIKYGLYAAGDEATDEDTYPFEVRNEEKFSWFLLRYS